MKSETFEKEIKKWGNSFVIIIPPYIINAKNKFSEGELVKVRLSEVD